MRHELQVTGHAYRLRPIGDADAQFVVDLRTDPARARFLHPTSSRLQDQLDWLAAYYERTNDFYFLVERRDTGTPEGLVAIYDIDWGAKRGEWGRWILRPGSFAAIESAWLIYRCGFELLRLDEIYSRTAATNVKVVSFHDSCVIPRRTVMPGHFSIGGEAVDAVQHVMDRETWRASWPRLDALAAALARKILKS